MEKKKKEENFEGNEGPNLCRFSDLVAEDLALDVTKICMQSN